MKLLGVVNIDSGQLVVCDPCYIDSEWKKEDFQDIRIFKHKETGDTLQYGVDFPHFEAKIPKYNRTMNELIRTGDWQRQPNPEPKHGFSYNAACVATLSDQGYGQLNHAMGHPGVGVAFRSPDGDGTYDVVGIYDSAGRLSRLVIDFDGDLMEDADQEDV